jgi:rhomboid protease GluP
LKQINKPIATIVILAICILIQIAITFFNFSTETETAILLGAYYKAFIMAGEYWRLVTCGFVHISLWHLWLNGFSLMNIGTLFENRFGVWKYLLILFGSVLGGSLFQFASAGNTLSVGLSGGLYGLMGGYILMVMVSENAKRPEVISQLIRTIMINLMINFMPGIAVMAHLGGFLFGMVLTGLFLPEADGLRIRMAISGIALCLVTGWFVFKANIIREDQVYLLSDYRVLKKEKEFGLGNHAMHMAEKLDQIYGTPETLTSLLEAEE